MCKYNVYGIVKMSKFALCDLENKVKLTRGPRAWHSADRSRQGKEPDFELSLPVQYMHMHGNTFLP
jgi:hypothetical protein